MRSLKCVLAGVAVALAATPLRSGETVSHPPFGLSLTVPDGFVPAPGRAQGKVLFAFERPPAGDQAFGTFIAVSGLGGVLGRETLDPQAVAARNPLVTLTTETWNGFEIQVFRVPEQLDGVDVLTFNAQVPLKPEAVQVAVIGEAGREAELRAVLRSVLGSLSGQTNWLNTQQRVSKLAEGLGRMAATAGIVAIIAVAIWKGNQARRRRREWERENSDDDDDDEDDDRRSSRRPRSRRPPDR